MDPGYKLAIRKHVDRPVRFDHLDLAAAFALAKDSLVYEVAVRRRINRSAAELHSGAPEAWVGYFGHGAPLPTDCWGFLRIALFCRTVYDLSLCNCCFWASGPSSFLRDNSLFHRWLSYHKPNL
jgi:hypothetical protein